VLLLVALAAALLIAAFAAPLPLFAAVYRHLLGAADRTWLVDALECALPDAGEQQTITYCYVRLNAVLLGIGAWVTAVYAALLLLGALSFVVAVVTGCLVVSDAKRERSYTRLDTSYDPTVINRTLI